jgi:hypothetical protein
MIRLCLIGSDHLTTQTEKLLLDFVDGKLGEVCFSTYPGTFYGGELVANIFSDLTDVKADNIAKIRQSIGNLWTQSTGVRSQNISIWALQFSCV